MSFRRGKAKSWLYDPCKSNQCLSGRIKSHALYPARAAMVVGDSAVRGSRRAWRIRLAKTYTGRADIAILRTGMLVSFDPKIRTVSDTDPGAQGLDSFARRRSLNIIGTTLDLQKRVIELMGDQLPDALRDPARLQSVVTFTEDGDLFTVAATTDNPQVSKQIANTWATEYIARVNTLFSDSPTSEDIVRKQAAEAKQDYDAKEAAVLTFMQSNPIEPLKRQQALLINELDAQITLENKLQISAADVQALRSRLAASGATPSSADQITQILIQANAFNNTGSATGPLNLVLTPPTVPEVTTQAQLQQLDDLAKAIDGRRQKVSDTQMQTWHSQLNVIQSQLEQATQQIKELQAARDLAWNTYQTLNNKVAEVHVSNGAQNDWVRLATPAAPPVSPNAPRTALNVLIGGLLGLVIGFVLALALDLLRGRSRVLEPAPR
jgi:uncharacterized protein involved in exopolysaccharide biosynthesis